MPEVVEMSRHKFSIAYAGGKLEDHSINVEVLAPALLAFGKLMREANAEFNGKKAKANVYVASDFEHKCFNINFELAIGFYEKLKLLLQLDDVKNAKEVLEWIGLISPPAAGLVSFLSYLRWKKGRKHLEVREIREESGAGTVVVEVEGENNSITVSKTVYNLSRNPRALRATRDAFLPIGHDDFEHVEVREGDRLVGVLESQSIEDIVASCTTAIAESAETEPDIDTTTAWLSVYSPVYDEKADNWRFRYGADIIYADISETTIAQDALKRGGALIEDAYLARLEISTGPDDKGVRARPRYKILEVLKFIQAEPRMRQSEMPLGEDGDK